MRCTVTDRRHAAGLSVTSLAARIGISRQALSAIEAERSVPSTEVALALARELRCPVEALFALDPVVEGPFPALAGRRAALARISGRWVAHPLADHLPADAVVDAAGAPQLLGDPVALEQRALVAGCAPVLGVLAGRSERGPGSTWVHASSGAALRWLAEGRCHIAGMHLAERDDPGSHEALVRQALGGDPVTLIRLVSWREGLLVAPGNPLGLSGPADLARPGLRTARRPEGSGAARVLAQALCTAGVVPAPSGPLVHTHAESAQAIRFGAADVAVAIEPVAEAFGLGFLPLVEERFELAVRTEHLAHPGVARFLDDLVGRRFATEVRHLGAYDLDGVGSAREVAA